MALEVSFHPNFALDFYKLALMQNLGSMDVPLSLK